MSNVFGVLKGILADFASFFSFKTKTGRVRLGVLAVLLLIVVLVTRGGDESTVASVRETFVSVAPITSFTNSDALSLVGTIDTLESADIHSEVSGRVTSVPVRLGQTVSAGAVVATFENAVQHASLLQAQGAYEAALAAAASGNVTVEQAGAGLTAALDSATSVYRGAYSSVSTGYFTTLDNFFADPNGYLPGVRVRTGETQFLNTERVAFQTILREWQQATAGTLTETSAPSALADATEYANRTIALVDIFIDELRTDHEGEVINGVPVATLQAQLSTLRTSLNGTLASLQSAQSAITSAQDTLRKAELGGTNSELSAANAQVKQALGVLRAAEAAYNKTIVRTPISGSVNSVSVKVGEYLGAQSPVVKITNDSAYEVTVYLNEVDIVRVSVGQVVELANSATGTVAAAAPGIDSATGKYEVKIQTTAPGLVAGATTPVVLPDVTAGASKTTTLLVPIAAVRFDGTDGSLFTVNDAGVLEALPVQVGRVSGGMVEILGDVSRDLVIVSDVRGLTAGQEVMVSK